MVGVAQLVRALVCGTSCRGFESHHPPTICESGGIGRRAGFRYQYLWCESSSLSSRKKAIMRNMTLIILLVLVVTGCSVNKSPKILINNDNYICISSEKASCIKVISKKCSNSYDLLKEEHYNYFFKEDKYIVTFVCR